MYTFKKYIPLLPTHPYLKRYCSIIRKLKLAHKEEIMFDCSNEIGKYKCTTCSDYHTNFRASLKDHIKDGHLRKSSEHYVYKCMKCFFVTNSFYLMGRHSLFSECATNNKVERKERFLRYLTDQSELEQCPSIFNLELTVRRHKEVSRFECEQSKFKPKQNPEDIHCYSSSHGSYKCTRNEYLKQHIELRNSKSEDQRFQCAQCSSKLKTKRNLQKHLISHHTKPEDIVWYDCPHCSHKSKFSTSLKKHIKLRHSKLEDIRWYECPQCSYQCKRNNQLKRHITCRHSKPEDIQWFQCEQCTSRFKIKGDLQRHSIARHTKPENIRWYNCPHCSYTSKTSRSLKRHINRKHTKLEDIQWFQCENCSYKSKTKDELRRHLIGRHTKPEDIRWLQCEQCSSKFKTKGDLRGHSIARHTKPEDIRWFNCPHCSFKSKTSGNLKQHIKSLHSKPQLIFRLSL